MEIQKHEIELNRIKSYVDKHSGYDISTRSRKAEVVLFRALYFKLATDTTSWSLEKIGKIVDRDHATVLHSKKLFEELMRKQNLAKLYAGNTCPPVPPVEIKIFLYFINQIPILCII